MSGKPVVQDVTPDKAIKMSDKGVFLVRKDAKEVKFYKKDEELPRYTYKRLFEDKSKIRFRNVEDFKDFMILVDGNDNSIEYHAIRDQRFFKCRLSDYCPFHIRIVPSYKLPNGKGKIVNYRINSYILHNHTKEAL